MRLPRPLHPGAWWLWALGLATAASRTTQPLLLGAGHCGRRRTSSRRDVPTHPGHAPIDPRSSSVALVVVIRMVFEVVFGADAGAHVLFTLPSVPLPDWMAGVTIGGPRVGRGPACQAFGEGLQIAAVIACIGAASSLASPTPHAARACRRRCTRWVSRSSSR